MRLGLFRVTRSFRAVAAAASLLSLTGAGAASAGNTTVRLGTFFGDIDITLYDDAAPATVANFLDYVNSGAYDDVFLHRLATGFVLQGGGFTYTAADGVGNVPQNAPVVNEFGVPNTRGTVAMAKLGGDPDSATNQFFFNLDDNRANLDNQNGGFTVFGRVVGDGMAVVDQIAALPRFFFGSSPSEPPFNEVPLKGQNGDPLEDRFVFMESIAVISVMDGDFNGNGQVEQGDLDLVLQNWGQTASQAVVGLYGLGPGTIGQGALDAVLQDWGGVAAPDFSAAPPGVVPEPGALGVAALAALAGLRRRVGQ